MRSDGCAIVRHGVCDRCTARSRKKENQKKKKKKGGPSRRTANRPPAGWDEGRLAGIASAACIKRAQIADHETANPLGAKPLQSTLNDERRK